MSRMTRYDDELLALDTRIRRLGIACGLDPARTDTVVALIKGNFDVCRAGTAAARRELRGLLMMKYRIEESCIADLGAADCLRIIEDEEKELRRRGLPPAGLEG